MSKLSAIQSALILPSAPDKSASGRALLVSRGTAPMRGLATDLAAQAQGPLALIVPGQDVRALTTAIPNGTKGSERETIARFAHEDALASDPDGLHVVLSAEGGSETATRLIARDVMQRWIADFDPAAIVADFDALITLGPDPIALLDRVVQPSGADRAGFAIDLDWSDGVPPRADEAQLAKAIFDALNGAGPMGAPLNLRSGAFRRRVSFEAGPWGKVAAAALICGLLGFGLNLAQTRAVSKQADAISAEARAAYQSATGQPAPDNLIRALRSQDGPSDSAPVFLDLSQILFDALAQRPDIQVERLSYEAREGSLRLRLIYPNFDAAGELESVVRSQGGQLIPGGVREQNGQFIGDAALRLELGS